MRIVLLGLVLFVTCLAKPNPDIQVVVPPSAAHPQSWLRPQIRDNPNPDYRGKPASSLAEFVAPEVISKIVVDQYAGPPDDVRRYLAAMPTTAAQYFGPSLELCAAHPIRPALTWTSTSTVTFESGRSGTLAVATVDVARVPATIVAPRVSGVSGTAECVGFDRVPVGSLYVRYADPDGHTWSFAVPLQRKK